MKKFIKIVATLTRKFHPLGVGRVLRLLYHPNKRRNDFIETVIPYDGNLRIRVNTGHFIEWCIFFNGYYEPTTVKLIKQYLPIGGTFVDIGANIGCLSLIASKIAGKVIAIEPVENLANKIKSNCELNNLTNVSVLPIAISNTEGSVPFYIVKENEGCGSVYSEHFRKDEVNEVIVEAKTLDNVLKNEERVDFIKIDTEGHDGNVLAGALRTIEKHRPVIIFEYGNDWNLSPMKETLERLGYDLKIVNGFNVSCTIPKKEKDSKPCSRHFWDAESFKNCLKCGWSGVFIEKENV